MGEEEARFLWLGKLSDAELRAIASAVQLWVDEGNPKELRMSDKQWEEAANAAEDILAAALRELLRRNAL